MIWKNLTGTLVPMLLQMQFCKVKCVPKRMSNLKWREWPFILANKPKITRRTTGAQGCNFLTSLKQFWMILCYLSLSRSVLIYLSPSIPFYRILSWSFYFYLVLHSFLGSVSASISDFVHVCVCVCEQPIFSSRNDHFHLVAPLNWLINKLIN